MYKNFYAKNKVISKNLLNLINAKICIREMEVWEFKNTHND